MAKRYRKKNGTSAAAWFAGQSFHQIRPRPAVVDKAEVDKARSIGVLPIFVAFDAAMDARAKPEGK